MQDPPAPRPEAPQGKAREMNMKHDRYQEMVGEMLDGELADQDRSELMRHLSECAECQEELEAISTLRGQARALPRGIAPSRDLWSGISAKIAGQEQESPVIELASRRPRVGLPRRWAPLAAAAVLLVVASSGLTFTLMKGADSSPIAAGAADTPAAPVAQTAATTALAAFRPAEAEYQTTVSALEAELAVRRESLAPETIEVIERNLAIIDEAIAEATAALEADPSSMELSRHLSGIYRQKVSLLGSAVKIAT